MNFVMQNTFQRQSMEKRILDKSQKSLEMRKTHNFITNNKQDINVKFGINKSYQNLNQNLP